jgi:hypothetical protein
VRAARYTQFRAGSGRRKLADFTPDFSKHWKTQQTRRGEDGSLVIRSPSATPPMRRLQLVTALRYFL